MLLTGGIGASILFTGGTADAAPCAPGFVDAGAGCTIVGTLVLTGGSLALDAPVAVGWGTAITGADQFLSDQAAADETYTVDDASGTSAGWSVSASSTAFATTTGTVLTLGTGTTTPTFSTDGSLAVVSGAIPATAPSAACAATTTCTVGTNSLAATYPVTITAGPAATGTTPVDIYTAPAGSGVGTIVIGGSTAANPVGWWINVPSNTLQGTYIGAVTLDLLATV